MDPDHLEQDIEGSLGGAGIPTDVPEDADTAPEVRMLPERTSHDESHWRHHRDDAEASSGVVDPGDIVVEKRPTESNPNFVAADDRTASSTTRGTAAMNEHNPRPQQVSNDDLPSNGRLWPEASGRSWSISRPLHAAAEGGESTIDDHDAPPNESPAATADPSIGGAVSSPNDGIAPQPPPSPERLSSPTGNSSNSSDAGSGGTDEEERSSTEGRYHNQPETGIKETNQGRDGGGKDRPNDLPTQLNRIWGASPPDRAEGLAVMRDMLGYRAKLDGILSRLVAAEVRCCRLKHPSPCFADLHRRTGSRETRRS